jgi:hypothetical protein
MTRKKTKGELLMFSSELLGLTRPETTSTFPLPLVGKLKLASELCD